MILNDEQRMIQASMRTFAETALRPHAAEWDRLQQFPHAALRELAQLGGLGITVPVEWGGAGLDTLSLALILEEIAAGDGATSTIVSVHNSLVCAIVLRYGNDAQKAAWLRRLASGECLGAFCLTEPEAGSDAAALRTRARRDGDGWRIDGVKQFITSGKEADLAVVFAVTDPDLGKGGISCFLVPTDSPGYTVARLEDKLGQRASDTAQIVFDNCRVGADALVGEIGKGYGIALANLESGRIGIAAQAVGMARAALHAALAYAKDRRSFGRAIIDHQAVSFRLADMATEVDAARLLVWRAASLKDSGSPCLAEASMAKLFASEMAERVASAAIQIHGGYGYVSDFAVERIYRDVRVCQIYEGTSDIQRLVIGRSLAAGH